MLLKVCLPTSDRCPCLWYDRLADCYRKLHTLSPWLSSLHILLAVRILPQGSDVWVRHLLDHCLTLIPLQFFGCQSEVLFVPLLSAILTIFIFLLSLHPTLFFQSCSFLIYMQCIGRYLPFWWWVHFTNCSCPLVILTIFIFFLSLHPTLFFQSCSFLIYMQCIGRYLPFWWWVHSTNCSCPPF